MVTAFVGMVFAVWVVIFWAVVLYLVFRAAVRNPAAATTAAKWAYKAGKGMM